MAFKTNQHQQLSLTDSSYQLTERERKFLDKSWAKPFSEIIFPSINEEDFSVLYSLIDSRPNTPVNVIIGALLLKEMQGLTDDEVVEALMFDIRYQYALHTTSYKEQPLSDRSLGRFRERCLAYETETGNDLIKNCILQLSEGLTAVMGINGTIKRMDSMMIASNIRNLSRFELIYSCVARFIKYLKGIDYELPESLAHYIEKEDYNRVVYHTRNTDIKSRYEIVLADAKFLVDTCRGNFDESADYQLLIRVLKEQTKSDENGGLILKNKSDDDMDSSVLQSPIDPDATYRYKAGKGHSGYAANLTESLGKNCSIVSDYDYRQNTYSDSQFLKDTLNQQDKTDDKTTLLADGAYGGTENHTLAVAHNVELVTTNFQGRKPSKILADFEFSKDGKQVLKCPNGQIPITNKYNSSSEQCRITMNKEICNSCPFKDQCNPKFHKTKTSKVLSWKSVFNAKQLKYMKTDEFKKFARIRNGVETLPSIMRRKYHVDTMPVRGLLRTKLRFGFKVGALNTKKLLKFISGSDSCTQNLAMS